MVMVLRTALVGLSSTLGLALVALAALSPANVERWYATWLGPRIAMAVGLPGSVVPFSLAEWVELGAIGLVVGAAVALAVALVRGQQPRHHLVGRAVIVAWAAVAPVLLFFYVVWGLAYARPTADERLGWTKPGDPPIEITDAELAALGAELVDEVNELYLELHGWPDGYAPSEPTVTWDVIDRDIDRAWGRLVDEYGLEPEVARSRGPAKFLLSSGVFTWLGIGGFYFPFTGEANINSWTPAWQMPHTIAHEKAHQRFVASENEANFMGFLACIHADEPFVRYAGYLFAQRQVLMALQDGDPVTTDLIRRRLPGVQRDVNHARAFWSGYDGPLEKLGSAVNDTYLRVNRVKGGIRSYSRSVELVVEWSRRRAPDGT